ncbi:MAG: DNA polymerase III subunit beta [Sorangium cellulosum]|nr:MAG: DNA polymerase III subunit beta [Sorangium cellulosum]
MNITVPKKDLLRLVARCQGVVDKKSTMPVLANVLINVDTPNAVRVAATDLYLATLELEVSLLSRLINQTQFSISTDETRAHLNSALFEWDGNRVRMVTTDGHRLTKVESEVPDRKAAVTMLIPYKAIGELRKLTEESRALEGKSGTSMVTIAQSGPNAFFGIGDTKFSVKLVDAQFPAYQQVIPQTTERRVRAPRAALVDALRAVSLAASDRTGGIKLSIESGTMRITSESPESGDGFDEVPVDYSGEQITIGFNAKYMLEVLAVLDDEEVDLLLSGELDPAIVKPAGESEDRSFIGVVMPMRI